MGQELTPFKETSGIWIVATPKITWTDKAGLYSMLYLAGPIVLHVRTHFPSHQKYINKLSDSSWNYPLICVLLARGYRRTRLHQI